MKRAFLFLMFAAALAVNGCATAIMSGAADGDNAWSASGADSRITREVRTAIYRDAVLDAARITVTTRQGVVTLDGTVAEPAHIQHARQIAAGVAGVSKVIIQLRVKDTR